MCGKLRYRPCRREERRGSNASQSNGCCFDPAVLELVFASGETRAAHFIHSRSKSLSGSTELQAFQSKEQEQKRKKLGKEIGMMRRCRMSGMKVILLILIGVSTPRNGAQERDTSRTPPPRTPVKENGEQEKLANTLEINSQGEDPRTFAENSQGKDLQGQRPSGEEVARTGKAKGREVEEEEEKEEEGEAQKKKMGKKRKESIARLLTLRRKEDVKEKESRKPHAPK